MNTNPFPAIHTIIEIQLQAEYRSLSRLLEYFPKGSKHKAMGYIEKRMDVILDELKSLYAKDFDWGKKK